MRSVAAAAALSLALAALTGPTVAVASGDTKVDEFRAIKVGKKVRYRGKIKADLSSCEEERTVEIYHKGVLIATTKTKENGEFTVRGPRPPKGDEVTARVVASAGPRFCDSAEKTIKYKG